jgi:hypothetical protein
VALALRHNTKDMTTKETPNAILKTHDDRFIEDFLSYQNVGRQKFMGSGGGLVALIRKAWRFFPGA